MLQALCNLQPRGRSLGAQQRGKLDLAEPGMLRENGRRPDQMRHDAAEARIPAEALDQEDMDRMQIQAEHWVSAFAQHRLDSLDPLRMQTAGSAWLLAGGIR